MGVGATLAVALGHAVVPGQGQALPLLLLRSSLGRGRACPDQIGRRRRRAMCRRERAALFVHPQG